MIPLKSSSFLSCFSDRLAYVEEESSAVSPDWLATMEMVVLMPHAFLRFSKAANLTIGGRYLRWISEQAYKGHREGMARCCPWWIRLSNRPVTLISVAGAPLCRGTSAT